MRAPGTGAPLTPPWARGTVFIAGHGGMVGGALLRHWRRQGVSRLLTADRARLDLRRQDQVQAFFREHHIDAVLLAAARVGGIHANATAPADFIHDNLMIQAQVIQAAHQHGVQHLLCLGSSCIYPRLAAQPMREEALLTGLLEPTNEPYAVAKIAGIKLCESYNRQHGRDYRAVMPTNLYGPGDNHHPTQSHVIPALMRRLHEAVRDGAPEVVIWGSGQARREFLHVDDLAEACWHVLALPSATWQAAVSPQCSHLNVGTGQDCTIAALAGRLAEIVGYRGRLVFDPSRPDGAPRKCLDVSRLQALGWQARIGLQAGLAATYRHYRQLGPAEARHA